MGFPFAKFFGVLQQLGPIVAPVVMSAVPGGAALLPFVPVIVHGIADAEQKPGATGAEKKAFVLQLVADAAAGTNLAKPHTIDPDLLQAAAGQAIDAVITSVKAVQVAHAALPAMPAPESASPF